MVEWENGGVMLFLGGGVVFELCFFVVFWDLSGGVKRILPGAFIILVFFF